MKLRKKLQQLTRSDRKNRERIEAYTQEGRKWCSDGRVEKPMCNMPDEKITSGGQKSGHSDK